MENYKRGGPNHIFPFIPAKTIACTVQPPEQCTHASAKAPLLGNAEAAALGCTPWAAEGLLFSAINRQRDRGKGDEKKDREENKGNYVKN